MKKSYLIGLSVLLLMSLFSLTLTLGNKAEAAITAGEAICTTWNKTTGTELECNTATNPNTTFSGQFDNDNLTVAVLWFAGNNVDPTDTNNLLLSSVTDSGGNSWTVRRCYTNGQTAAAAGATTCIATAKITAALTSASWIKATFSNSIEAKAFVVKEFKVDSGNTIALAGTATDAQNDDTSIYPGSMTISGLTSSTEYLFVRATALERTGGGNWTATVSPSHTSIGTCIGTRPGSGATNMDICGEYRIVTDTTDTSNPTATSVDSASIFLAFKEVSASGGATQLAFYVHPPTTGAGVIMSPDVSVEIQNQYGNRVTSDSSTQVTVAIDPATPPSNPGSGTLSGLKTVTASAGLATFSSLSIAQQGVDYKLIATSLPVLNPATSDPFNITAGAFGLTQCMGDRYGSTPGCQSQDVKITNVTLVTPLTSCIGGESLVVDLNVTVLFGGGSRFDAGIFISNDGNDPSTFSNNTSSCKVAVLPVPPFENLEQAYPADTCGDGSSGLQATFTMTDVTIICKAISLSGGKLYIPYSTSWDVQSNPQGKTCSSAADPVPSGKPKCNTPNLNNSDEVAGSTVNVLVVPKITKSRSVTTPTLGVPFDYTVVISNDTGVTLTNALFQDDPVTQTPSVPETTLQINSVMCPPALLTGGATCPASVTVSGMKSPGLTIPTMPANTAQAITNITQANPAVVTYSGADTFAPGDKVKILNVVGMTEVSNREFTVGTVDTGLNTFQLSGVDSTGYTAYTSGGSVTEISTITFIINATLLTNPTGIVTNTAYVTAGSGTASASSTIGGSGSGSGGSRVRVIKWREVFK